MASDSPASNLEYIAIVATNDMFLNVEGTLNTDLKQQMHEYMDTELALTQQFMPHLYNPKLLSA